METLPLKLSKCWKVGNNFEVQIFQFKKTDTLKLSLQINIIKHYHKAFFFEWVPGLEVPGDKKNVLCPLSPLVNLL